MPGDPPGWAWIRSWLGVAPLFKVFAILWAVGFVAFTTVVSAQSFIAAHMDAVEQPGQTAGFWCSSLCGVLWALSWCAVGFVVVRCVAVCCFLVCSVAASWVAGCCGAVSWVAGCWGIVSDDDIVSDVVVCRAMRRHCVLRAVYCATACCLVVY